MRFQARFVCELLFESPWLYSYVGEFSSCHSRRFALLSFPTCSPFTQPKDHHIWSLFNQQMFKKLNHQAPKKLEKILPSKQLDKFSFLTNQEQRWWKRAKTHPLLCPLLPPSAAHVTRRRLGTSQGLLPSAQLRPQWITPSTICIILHILLGSLIQ